MVRVAIVIGFGLAACVASQPEPAIASHVESFVIPQEGAAMVDLLFVIDDSPAMASERDHLIASMPTFASALTNLARPLDLHIGVTTADPVDAGKLRGASGVDGDFLVDALHIDGATERNFTGDLGAALTALADVGAAGTDSSQPLEAARLALAPGANAGFHRDHAYAIVVVITNRDDESLEAITTYVTELKSRFSDPNDLVISAIYPRPATRLDAFVAQFPNRNTYTPLDAPDLSVALELVGLLYKSDPGVPCMTGILSDPVDCAFADVVGGVERLIVPCDAAITTSSCWRFVADPNDCLGASPLRLEIQRTLFPPRGDLVVGQCVVLN